MRNLYDTGLKFPYLVPTKNRDRDAHEEAQAGRPMGVGPAGPGGFSAPWTPTFSEVPINKLWAYVLLKVRPE